MTDTSTPARIYGQGRKPPYPPGHPRRLAIPWLHELDPDLPVAVSYPLDLTNGIKTFPMWGNGPDTTLTIPDAEGAPTAQGGQPVGDCHFAGTANAAFLDGNPAGLSSNVVVGCYDTYEADSQGVPLGREQDDGVVMSDALTWQLTHDWTGKAVALGQGIVRAFVPVQPLTVPAVMAKYRKPLLMGVNLTNQDQNTFPTWNESPSNPPNEQEGHVVVLALLRAAPSDPADTFGPAGPISWTEVVEASESWMNSCPEEFWMPVTDADADKMGQAAFDALVGLMATLPGFEGEKPPVAPVPAPTPPAPAPVPSPSPVPVPAPPVTPTPPGPMPQPPGPLPVSHLPWYEETVKWIEDSFAWLEAEIVGRAKAAFLDAAGHTVETPADLQARFHGTASDIVEEED